MTWRILYSAEAIADLRRLRAFDRAAVMDGIQARLVDQPDVEAGTTVKRLRQPAPVGYRLRVGDMRVYYDIEGDTVYVVRILTKPDSLGYLGAER
jgi:mRNA-degrading endonuclease RelE of RelBE toxin-antitoxin system